MVSSAASHFECEMTETHISASSWTVFTCNFGANDWGWGTVSTLDRVFDPSVIHNKTYHSFTSVPYLTTLQWFELLLAGGAPIGEIYLVISMARVHASDIP